MTGTIQRRFLSNQYRLVRPRHSNQVRLVLPLIGFPQEGVSFLSAEFAGEDLVMEV